jgi:hypothetical protein
MSVAEALAPVLTAMSLQLWQFVLLVVVVGFVVIAAAVVGGLVAGGTIPVAPVARFNVVSITDDAGADKNPNFTGTFTNVPVFALDAVSDMVALWQRDEDPDYYLALYKLTGGLWKFTFLQNGSTAVLTGPSSVVGSGSGDWKDTDPVAFTGQWATASGDARVVSIELA